MLIFKKTFFLLSVLLVISSNAQTEETIVWKPNLVLNWANFKGKTPKNNRAAAVTASGITYKYTTYFNREKGNKFTYEVIALFYPNKSWYRPSISTNVTLAHEQLHFDIAEIYARKMRNRLSKIKPSKNTRKEVKEIYSAINKELNAYQDLYDAETNYSRNLEKQLLWQTKVKKQLKLK
ncbi:DUF922 domain-containing protein [Cellulophaga omnivescoria]|uniref:DUF922 domain-containing protein n=1 Tax=Cellulophaga omnivescoria TaxID=1888890 RepID=UPI00098540E7|nr:DUF922 domain-containing protein [Cellulophaga omnivescoria]WKB81655.1 DUF922 domain-containing protein [Cellulophaga lytica]